MTSPLPLRRILMLLTVVASLVATATTGTTGGAKRPVFLYVNSNLSDWNDVCVDVKQMIEGGVTHVILAFFLYTGIVDVAKQWDMNGVEKQKACMAYAHAHGAKIMLSAGGSTEVPYSHDPKDYGSKVAKEAVRLLLDGVDFDLEGLPPHFDSQQYYDWVVQSSRAARDVFNAAGKKDAVISHAPQAPYFTSWAGSKQGYLGIMKDLGDVVDYYFVQYYNQQVCTYLTYESIFLKTDGACWAAGAAWQELKEALGSDAKLINKIAIGKPVTQGDVYNTGFVDPKAMEEILCKAEKEIGFRGGIMGWSWRGKEAEAPWLGAIGGDMCGGGGGSSTTTAAPPTTGAQTTAGPTTTAGTTTTTASATGTIATGTTTTGTTTTGTGPKKGCFVSKIWWAHDCDDQSLCLHHPAATTEADCVAVQLPLPVWAATTLKCRQALHDVYHCQTPPLDPDTPTSIPPGTPGCYTSTVWWASSCDDKQLCQFNRNLNSKSLCDSSELPLATWADSEAGCRKDLRGLACTA